MNFNEEMERELKEFGTGKLEIIPEEERATVEDWRNLDKRALEIDKESTELIRLSQKNAKFSSPLGLSMDEQNDSGVVAKKHVLTKKGK